MTQGLSEKVGTGFSVRQAELGNVPALRFPEFEGEWRTEKLTRKVTKVGSGVTPKGGAEVYLAEGVPLIRSQNIRNDALDLSDVAFISEEMNSSMSGSAVQPNDLLLNITGASIGRSCVAPADFRIGNVNQHVCIIRLAPDAAPNFLQTFLSSYRGQKLIFQSQSGSGREGLNFENIRAFKIAFPSLPEQKKIAAFLGVVDARIAALRARVAGLTRYKRGLMQALFSQRLRFTKPDGTAFPDWEEKRLGDLLTVRYGKDHKDIPDGEFPVFGTGGTMRHVNRSLHDGPSVLIGRKGTIDRPRFVTQPFWTVDTLFYSDIKPDYLPFFVFLVVQWINWLKYNEATGVPSLSATAIHSVKVTVPTHPDEQAKIADALSTMDSKIAAVGAQVDKMEAFKKGLLQQMFV